MLSISKFVEYKLWNITMEYLEKLVLLLRCRINVREILRGLNYVIFKRLMLQNIQNTTM